jgi:acrylyl-CoA reductase (NADPH)
MMMRALVITENQDNSYSKTIQELPLANLPADQVLIKVEYSTLNYKDALSSIGNKGVTRVYPHTPGIDAAGVVVESQSTDIKVGSQVIVTSYDLGMNTPGGLAEYIRVPASWIIALPQGLSLAESMILGTAGLTAGLSVQALINQGIEPDMGPVLVTGATGGVGSMALAILSKLGYQTVALTGKPKAAEEYLTKIGAGQIIDRSTLESQSPKPLLKSAFAGAIDTVGGDILANILKALMPNGAVACCGLVASAQLNTTVLPFILRGNALIGIDSATCQMPKRLAIWQKLSTEWKPQQLANMAQEISLEAVPAYLDLMLAGQLTGKILVKI